MIKIALIDDHQLFLDGISSLLSKESNIEILFIENSAIKAIKKIIQNPPDLIITDISMPEMNGIEFIKIIKRDFPKIKILVVSMFKTKLPHDSIDGFILKESNTSEFIKAIDSIFIKKIKYFIDDFKNEENLISDEIILTKREKEITRLIAEGYNSDEISKKLFLSRTTIITHRRNIFFKLQVNNIAGLVKKAYYLGIISH